MEIMEAKERIILALDTSDADEAMAWTQSSAGEVGMFKVGSRLFTAHGPDIVREIATYGPVFLDLKYHDIPVEMAGAAENAADLGVKIFSVHASSGVEAMMAANSKKGPALMAVVTILTSLSEDEAEEICKRKLASQMYFLTSAAISAGADAIICSPMDLRKVANDRLLKITPAIRPKWAPIDSQRRVATPYDAIMAGADYLVIGRPITHPRIGESSLKAARLIVDEIEVALEAKAHSAP